MPWLTTVTSRNTKLVIAIVLIVACSVQWQLRATWQATVWSDAMSQNDSQQFQLPLEEANAQVEMRQNKSSNSVPGLPNSSTKLTLLPRAWKRWPRNQTLPCLPPGPQGLRRRVHTNTTRGLFLVKPEKTGSSTAATVHLHIMHQLAQRRGKPFPFCHGSFRHGSAVKFQQRVRGESFLWSILRDPTKRVVSEFFHFEVSRNSVTPTDGNFQQWLHQNRNRYQDYYHQYLSLRTATDASQVMEDYDYIAVTERFDESMVVLQLLLGLSPGDILYISAKHNGGWDDGAYKKKCFFIPPAQISPGMQAIFAGPEWQSAVERDTALHRIVNASLDRTIEETIGRAQFQRALQIYRHAQEEIVEVCRQNVTFPCSQDGVRRSLEETNCYWTDLGCGYDCIDRMAAEKGLFTTK